jgi:hypothetical protein
MLLKIYNTNRLVGTQFWNGIFVFRYVQETDTNYRFQFQDTRTPNVRVLWIEVSRIGHYNRIEQEWEYRLNYMKCPHHTVTAEWFEDYKNVIDTFGAALKNSM